MTDFEEVLCPLCKRTVAVKTEHSTLRDSWIIRCGPCDVWSVVPSAKKAPKVSATHCRPDKPEWLHQWEASIGWVLLDGRPSFRQSVCARCFALRVETVSEDPEAHEHPCFCRDGRLCKRAHFILIQG